MNALKGTVLVCAAVLLHTAQAHAQNLLSNGSFESGFTGWSVSGTAQIVTSSTVPVSSGTYAVAFDSASGANAMVSTTVSTVIGQAYRILFDHAVNGMASGQEILLTVTDGDGKALVSTTHPGRPVSSGYRTRSALFVATTTTTTISFTDVSFPESPVQSLLDNVQLLAVAPFAFPGKYTGTLKIGRSYPNEGIADSTVLNVKVYFNAAGQYFVIGEPDDFNDVGTIDNDGHVTLGDADSYKGTTTKLTRAAISFSFKENTSLSSNFAACPIVRTREFHLQRAQ